MHDFFIKDPISYESAFKQFGALEVFHLALGSGITTYNNYDKYADMLSIEESWQGHLDRVRINYE